MTYSRNELIEILTPILVKTTGSSIRSVKEVLQAYTIADLNFELAAQRDAGRVPDPQVEAIRASARQQRANDPAQIRLQQEHQRQMDESMREYALTQLFLQAVPGFGLPIRNQASEEMVLSWVGPGESLGRDFLKRVILENPSLGSQLQWGSADPEKRKQAAAKQSARDQQEFKAAAKALRFGMNQANLGLVRSTLGSGFSVYQIKQALASNALQLSPPSQQELEQWAAEDIEAANQQLLNATDAELRVRVRQESEARQQATRNEQAQRQLDAAQQRDAGMGFPKLPDTWGGQKLDATFIKTCSAETQKLITRRFGSSQVNARLQER